MSVKTSRFSAKLLATIAALSLMGSGVAAADDNDSDIAVDTSVSSEASVAPEGELNVDSVSEEGTEAESESVADSEETVAPDEENSEAPDAENSDAPEEDDVLDDEGGAAKNVVTDPKLRECINDHLNRGRNNQARLTEADMSQVKGTLKCYGDLNTLEGVQYLRQVETIDFQHVYVTNAQGLQKLSKKKNKLVGLRYPKTSSTTLPNLSGFKKLTLFAYDNPGEDYYSSAGKPLKNISNLGNLKNLKEIHLDNNNISDISAVGKLKKLEKVKFENNLISNVAPIAKLPHLTFVDFDYNNITSLPSSFKNLPTGLSIDMRYNKIRDFSNLPDKLDYLSHLNNQVSRNDDKPTAFAVEAIYNAKKDVTTIDMRSFRNSIGAYTVKSCKAEKKKDDWNGTWRFNTDYCAVKGTPTQSGKYVTYEGQYYNGQYFSYELGNTPISEDPSGYVQIKLVKKFSGIKVSGITLSGASKVTAGKSITLKATVSPANAANKKVTWKSSNTKIATVNKKTGKVTGKKVGTVTITATAKDGSKKKATKKITVIKPVRVKGVSISGSSKVAAGSRIALKAKISPSNATNKAVTWKSSNTKIATVNAKGVVTGKKAGKTVTITVTTKDGKKKASKKITVTKAEPVQKMYRLYNRVSHEHLYTADAHERDVLRRGDWNYEGIGWVAPKKSKTPVYRLYNPGLGDHHYTTDKHEVRVLTSRHGWRNEGVKWYSDDKKRVKVYRQFNPGLRVGSHNYTADLHEYKVNNARNGWRGEGVAWYAVRLK